MTLLLLHGASGNAATWSPVLASAGLPDAIARDLPGRGDTPGPLCDRVPALAAWLANELSAGPPVVLVGHSLGGAVGLQLALDAPQCLTALVLVSSAARLKVHPAILGAVAASTAEQPFELTAAFGPATPREVLEQYHGHAQSTPPATALADWTACDHFDVRDRLSSVMTPTLVLHGDQDALTVPRFQQRLAQSLPNGESRTLDGIGHMLPWEAPVAFGQAVRHWLADR